MQGDQREGKIPKTLDLEVTEALNSLIQPSALLDSSHEFKAQYLVLKQLLTTLNIRERAEQYDPDEVLHQLFLYYRLPKEAIVSRLWREVRILDEEINGQRAFREYCQTQATPYFFNFKKYYDTQQPFSSCIYETYEDGCKGIMSILNRNIGGKTLGVGSRLDVWVGTKNVRAISFKEQTAILYIKFLRQIERPVKPDRSNVSRAQQASQVIGLEQILHNRNISRSNIHLKEMHSTQILSENLENLVDVIHTFRRMRFQQDQTQDEEEVQRLTIQGQLIQVIRSVRENHLTLIKGPPGTGKTYHLAIAIQDLSSRLSSDGSIIVCTQSNYAADQVLNQVLQVIPRDDDIFCLRTASRGRNFLGRAYNVTLWKKLRQKLNNYRQSRLEYELNILFSQFTGIQRQQLKRLLIQFKRENLIYQIIKQSKIIICTVAYFNTYLHNKVKCQVLIMDEASQIAECDMVLAYLRAHPQKFILTGDQNQLTAHQYKGQQVQPIFKLLAKHQQELVINLSYCFRMAYRLYALTHRVFYSDRIFQSRTTQVGLLQFVNFEARAIHEGTSIYNLQQIRIATNIAYNLLEWYNPEEIGVLCFYGSQRIKTSEFFDRFDYLWQVKVGTVDSFQGQEFKAVILLTTSSDFVSRFMKDRNRVNVATSRAKEALYIVGKRSNLCKSTLWTEILETIDEINGQEGAPVLARPVQRPTLRELLPLINSRRL